MGNNCCHFGGKKRKKHLCFGTSVSSVSVHDFIVNGSEPAAKGTSSDVPEKMTEDEDHPTPVSEETSVPSTGPPTVTSQNLSSSEDIEAKKGVNPDLPPIQNENWNRTFHEVRNGDIRYHLPKEYDSDLQFLGGGSYGTVVRAKMRSRDGQMRDVAIKKLRDAFIDANQACRVYRELRLLQLMKHENIIRAVDIYTPDQVEHQFKNVYVVTEYAGTNLHRILQMQRNSGQAILDSEHIKFIIYQILRALKYIHSANVIHRDLKPSNLALTNECDLTVLDFGLARSLENTSNSLTQYVMTRWYRSPEVIYWNIGAYNQQADIWSVGCIAAELVLGKPLFPGEDPNAQYTMITELVGSPDDELMLKIEQNNSPAMRQVIEMYPHHPRLDFKKYFQVASPLMIDFMDKILVLDPERRMTVEEALKHPYLDVFSVPEDEPSAPEVFILDDNKDRPMNEWKALIWNEIRAFKGDMHSPNFM